MHFYHRHGNFNLISSKTLQMGIGIGQFSLLDLEELQIGKFFRISGRGVRIGIGNEIRTNYRSVSASASFHEFNLNKKLVTVRIFDSVQESPRQTKERPVHELFTGAFRNKSSM